MKRTILRSNAGDIGLYGIGLIVITAIVSWQYAFYLFDYWNYPIGYQGDGLYVMAVGKMFADGNLLNGTKTDLLNYQKKWTERFGKEFDKQMLARKILERIDNETINKLFESITPEIIKEISEKDDFDFHTSSIIKLLGIKISLKTAQTLVSSELKKILG